METMGFLGPVGTHSEAAAIYLKGFLGSSCRMEAFPSIYSAILAVEKGKIETCLVPVENSLEGSINITLDTLAHSDKLCVVRELIWSVHNQLMVRNPKFPVKKILSHSQPLSQCRDYIRHNYPTADLEAVTSTSVAAAMVADSEPEEGLAAICTKRAGELNGLVTLATEIQDSNNNCTRFYQLRRMNDALMDTEPNKALLICQIDGKSAGSLCEVLMELANRNVNLTRIESRPARTKLGEYIFFLDVDVPEQRCQLDEAFAAIKERSVWIKTPGIFPVIRADGTNLEKL